MGKRKSRIDKIGKSVLARCAVICIVAAIISFSGIPVLGLAAVQAEDRVKVTVDAPEYVELTFDASIDVDNVTEFNSGQFDLSFDSSVVNVTEVREGDIEGAEVSATWDFIDSDTVRVLVNMPLGVGVTGSGYLAELEFEVKGGCSETSTLVLSNGLLVNTEAEAIEAEWYGDEVTVFCPVVSVDAPEYVEDTFNATIRIENVTEFNAGQFDLSFDSSVVIVTEVREGEIEGAEVSATWDFIDSDTVRVLVNMPLGVGVTGSGYLAELEFEVKGGCSETSTLVLSNGLLVNTEAEAIEAEWYGDEVTVFCPVVSVDAPEYVEDTFNATIRIENVTEFNAGQFDLSFDSSVVIVTEVREGEIEGAEVSATWDFIDSDTVRVLVNMPLGVGVTGSGYLAELEFEVKGGCSETSTLVLSNGLLVNTEAEAIEAEWYGDEVTVFCPVVSVDAPEYVEDTFNATIRIENVTEFNAGQFDLSFDSSVVIVTEARDGEIDGEAVPVFDWSFFDTDTIRVLVKLPGVEGASGSGYLAEVEFKVEGRSGEKSNLELSRGLLVNTEAEEIEAEWYGDEVTVLRT